MAFDYTRREFIAANSAVPFAGRWPIKEFGLTKMDYTRVRCPEAEAILATGVSCTRNESMSQTLVRETAAAIRKVAGHYAV